MDERPTGAVTFLFTDVEGSTQAWEQTPTDMDRSLEIHDRILREAIESNGGYVFAMGGDSFSAAFSSPSAALIAAAEAQRGLVDSECDLKVRMGVHSGEAVERDGNYFGPALNRTARLMSVGHGGQILVSTTTRGLVTGGDYEFVDLGEHRLADLSTPTRVVQLVARGLHRDFPALRSAVATDNLPSLGELFGRGDHTRPSPDRSRPARCGLACTAEFRDDRSGNTFPIHLQRLAELEAVIANELARPPDRPGRPALIDKVRQALQASSG